MQLRLGALPRWQSGYCTGLLSRDFGRVGSNPALGVSEYGVNGNIGDFQSLVVGSNPATRIGCGIFHDIPVQVPARLLPEWLTGEQS